MAVNPSTMAGRNGIVAPSTSSREAIAKSFNLEYCWFCGRPMNFLR